MFYKKSEIQKENITIIETSDSCENQAKIRYQIVELLIYFGWPLFVMFILTLFLPLESIYLYLITVIVFIWPYLKGVAGKVIAKVKNVKDPRHCIRSSSFWYDGFLFAGSEPLRRIRKYSALSESLDMTYNYFERFGVEPGNLKKDWWRKITPFFFLNRLIKAWTDFWINMPGAQDVRTRLDIISKEIERIVKEVYIKEKDRCVKIAVLAGGTHQDVIVAVSLLLNNYPEMKIRIVSVDPDKDFSFSRSKQLMKEFNVPEKIFFNIFERASTKPEKKKSLSQVLKKNGYNFKEFDLVICIGLGDYMFGDKTIKFLSMLDNGKKIIISNISKKSMIEKIFLHMFIQWPEMQYLPLEGYLTILEGAFKNNRKIKIIKTPLEVFNTAIIE
jgi:hypothetical protein